MVSKRHYSVVQGALQKRSYLVPANKTWSEIHNELGVGSLSGQQLSLTREDHATLRQWLQDEVGADPLNTDIKGDRLQVAKLARDEKWATQSVFSGMISVNAFAGCIPCHQADGNTPPGSLLSVPAESLDVSRIGSVVLVENGIVARNWYRCCFPDDLSEALMVYRGHGTESEACAMWLRSLPDNVRKIGYFDLDPAGLGIAVDYDIDAILIPDLLHESLLEGKNNKPDEFDKQMANRPELPLQLPPALADLWEWMSADNRRCAITQERIMVLGSQLRLISIKE
jgi:hypothetical protein